MCKKENGSRKGCLWVWQQTSHAPGNVSLGQQIKWWTKDLPETQTVNGRIGKQEDQQRKKYSFQDSRTTMQAQEKINF